LLEAGTTIVKAQERLKCKSHHCHSSRALEVGATIIIVWERLKQEPPSLELGSA